MFGANTVGTIAVNKSAETWPDHSDLFYLMLERPLEELKLCSILYNVDSSIGSLKFAYADGRESPMYGNMM